MRPYNSHLCENDHMAVTTFYSFPFYLWPSLFHLTFAFESLLSHSPLSSVFLLMMSSVPTTPNSSHVESTADVCLQRDRSLLALFWTRHCLLAHIPVPRARSSPMQYLRGRTNHRPFKPALSLVNSDTSLLCPPQLTHHQIVSFKTDV